MTQTIKNSWNVFLQLRNDLGSNNIRTLERILYTLNSAKSLTTQNRFLNFWSSLEYILYSFPRFTIIEKARVVVPEVFGLFYLKINLIYFGHDLLIVCLTKRIMLRNILLTKFYNELSGHWKIILPQSNCLSKWCK